jgi:hypothetical protein
MKRRILTSVHPAYLANQVSYQTPDVAVLVPVPAPISSTVAVAGRSPDL